MSASRLEKWQSSFRGLSGSHDLQIKPLARSELLLSDLEADTSLNIELLDQAYLRLFLVRSKSNSSEQNISLNIKLAEMPAPLFMISILPKLRPVHRLI